MLSDIVKSSGLYYYSLFAIRYSLFAIRYLPFTIAEGKTGDFYEEKFYHRFYITFFHHF
jgi:hypothetical protein